MFTISPCTSGRAMLPFVNSVIADSALQLAFAVAISNFRPFSALKSIHI